MATHKLTHSELSHVSPENLVTFSSNELVQRWEDKLNLRIWDEIGECYLKVKKNQKISDRDKLDCALKLGEIALRLKRSGSSEKGGAVNVQIVAANPTAR